MVEFNIEYGAFFEALDVPALTEGLRQGLRIELCHRDATILEQINGGLFIRGDEGNVNRF